MGKLLKYEIRKTWMVKLILLALAALLEIAFLIGLYGDKAELLGTSVVLLMLLAFTGVAVVGLASIVTLHRDMNTKQSYMLFMTPNSCYQILGAKVLEIGISILLAGAFFFTLGVLDVTLLFAKERNLNELWDMIRQMLNSIDTRIEINLPTITAVTVNLLCGWLAVITAAYLGEVVSAALLYGKRHNGLLSFILIVALLILVSLLQNWVGNTSKEVISAYLIRGVVSLVCSVGMYFLTARIMEEKLSV